MFGGFALKLDLWCSINVGCLFGFFLWWDLCFGGCVGLVLITCFMILSRD